MKTAALVPSPAQHPVPTYGWGAVPSGLFTRQQLAAQGLRPGPLRGRLVWHRGKREAHLFALGEAQAKRVVSEAQRQVLARGRATQAARQRAEEQYWLAEEAEEEAEEQERRQRDRDRAITWARSRLQRGRTLVLDTETTDLEEAYLVEIAILSLAGDVLLHTRVNPGVPIAPGATAIHGLRDADVLAAPRFCEVLPQLTCLLHGRRLLVYNASFDRHVLWRELHRHHRAQIGGGPEAAWRHACTAADAWLGQVPRWHCAKEQYAAFVNDWSKFFGNYRWYPLPGADHSAVGDCRAVVTMLHQMAAAPLSQEGT